MKLLERILSSIVMEDIIVGIKKLYIKGDDKANFQLRIGDEWIFEFNYKDLEKWRELGWIQIDPPLQRVGKVIKL